MFKVWCKWTVFRMFTLPVVIKFLISKWHWFVAAILCLLLASAVIFDYNKVTNREGKSRYTQMVERIAN